MNTSSLNEKPILPEPTLRRLPWYLSYVRLLANMGVERVSSTQISKALKLDASQIAKDLSFLNVKGKTRIGYEVSHLVDVLIDFLGFAQSHRAVVIGAGSLGSALMRDGGLAQYGLSIEAGFDVRDAVVGTMVGDTPVLHIDQLGRWQREHKATIAILTVPVEQSQRMADMAIASGFRAIWNFTPIRLSVPSHIVTANTSIYAHLAIIYNRLSNHADSAPVKPSRT